MLVLTRRPREQITIGPDVTVTVLDIHAGQVRLGITAPADVRVDRDEVRRRRLDPTELAQRSLAIRDAIHGARQEARDGR